MTMLGNKSYNCCMETHPNFDTRLIIVDCSLLKLISSTSNSNNCFIFHIQNHGFCSANSVFLHTDSVPYRTETVFFLQIQGFCILGKSADLSDSNTDSVFLLYRFRVSVYRTRDFAIQIPGFVTKFRVL